jgi:GrpB-like predicted nucleotidyltransferase (UPF0157 family)
MASVEIRDYDREWPAAFDDVAGRLRASLGEVANRIDHIGSTSVPGLASKDVIDVQVSVAPAALDFAAAALRKDGWTRGPGIDRDHWVPGLPTDELEWRKVFFSEPPGVRRVHVHVRIQGRANQRYALLFRDYLRAHPSSAQSYATLKRDLAGLLPDDSVHYAEVKDAVCDLIYFAAEAWAQWNGWDPGSLGT